MPAAPWIAPLGATLLMQAVASGMGHMLPVLAPVLTAAAGLAPEAIGPINALQPFGTILFLLLGGALLARLGPVRALQMGTAISAIGLLLAVAGPAPTLVAAALLLGVGYGPTPPSGSRILAATAPPGHRTLIFSAKQAGAPLGGALTGLLAAPVAEAIGWRPTLLLAVGLAAVAALAIQPLRAGLDAEREATRRVSLAAILGRANLAAPFAALRAHRLLLPIAALGICFSVAQGCLFGFGVTWLVQVHGLSLAEAGGAFAAMQAGGVVARIALGWATDRLGQGPWMLVAQAFGAAGAILLLVAQPAGAPLPLLVALVALAGCVAASWNGIMMAETARLTPPERLLDATSGSTLLVFCGYVAGPAVFGALVPWLGWSRPFLLVAALLALAGLLMALHLRRAGTR